MTAPTAREFWDRRAQVYDADAGEYYADAYRKTAECFRRYLRADDAVLDFACGTGIVTLDIAPDVKSVHAIDISGEMILRAQTKASARNAENVTFAQLDLFDDSLAEGSFDAVLACNVLLYVTPRAQVLARICALLKPGGIFLSVGDCLGEGLTRERVKKWWELKTGKRPFVSFDTATGLTREIARAGFTVLETENLFPAPPNLFIAAKKE